MATKFSAFAKRFLVILNIFIAAVFLLACLAPYLNPEKWWYISLLGLGFAFLFVAQIVFVFFWLVLKPRYSLVSFLSLLIGWKSILVFFALHPSADFKYSKSKDVLRVVHWNVARFIEWKRNNNRGSQIRLKMMDQLKAQNADVLCLAEFFHSSNPVYYDNLNYVRNKLGYPYYYYSWDDDGGDQWVGQAIFSKYPIIDSGILRFSKPTMPEALIHADIVFKGDTLRFYTTHLQSVKFRKQDYERLEKIKHREDSLLENSMNIFSKLRRGTVYRSYQTKQLKQALDSSPYPYIVTGDFNDVPNSYTYFTIGKDLQDAFLEKGFGVGRTYSFLSPTLRIDYILATKNFKVEQFNRFVRDYSDHYMLVADLKPED